MPRPKQVAEENPFFKLILWINILGMICTIAIMVTLACIGTEKPTKFQETLFEVSRNAFTLVFGTFVGLAGGRGARHDYVVDELPESRAPTAPSKKRGTKT